jgi:hypothetical protein
MEPDGSLPFLQEHATRPIPEPDETNRHQRFGGTYHLHLQITLSYSPADGGSMFLRNVGIYLRDGVRTQKTNIDVHHRVPCAVADRSEAGFLMSPFNVGYPRYE